MASVHIIKLLDQNDRTTEYVWTVKEQIRQAEPLAEKRTQREDIWTEPRTQEIVIALDETGVMLNVSSSAVELTGYSLEEQAGCETPLDIVHPRDWPRVAASINRAFANPGTTQSVLFRYRHKGGYWAEIFGAGNVQEDRGGRRLLWATLCDPAHAPVSLATTDTKAESSSQVLPHQKRGSSVAGLETGPQPEVTEPLTRQATVLVVEDEAAMREMVVRFLDELGYRVMDAADGFQALELLESHPEVDLLFSDVMLPRGMNGPALFERARRIRPDLKVLYTSIYSEHYFAYSGGLDRDARLLTKPYDKRTLSKHIEEALPEEARALAGNWHEAV